MAEDTAVQNMMGSSSHYSKLITQHEERSMAMGYARVEMGLLAGDLTRFRKTEERQFPQHQHIST